MCQISRVVKAVDSKSTGVDRHRFESCIWHLLLLFFKGVLPPPP